MQYRKLPKGTEQISVLGIGTSCQPCPMGLDVGLINKYYDLSRAGDVLAKSHYENLTTKADACVGCGHCNKRCSFHVDQAARMQEILAYFNS